MIKQTNILAIGVILLAIILTWNDLKTVHIVLFLSGLLFFGFRLINSKKNE